MSNHETIARPYAEALFAEALDRDQVDAWWPMIEALAQAALTGKGFLLDPRVQPSQKVSWLKDLVQQLPRPMLGLLQAMAYHGRLPVLADVKALYRKLWLKHEQRLEVYVTSAFALPNGTQSTLRAYLSKRYDRKIDLVVQEDRSLIGGFRLHIGDKVIDLTVQNYLNTLRQKMMV